MARVGDIFKTTSGGTPSRRISDYYFGSIPWVKSGELKSNIILDTEEQISDEAVKNSSAKVLPKGTLLIALYGATIGKLARLGIDAATNQAVCGIFENEDHELQYLYWYLSFQRRKLIEAGIGGAQPNISQTILKNLDIPLPPKPTQLAIVSKIEELFSELDKGIESLLTAKQQLKTYRQSVLKWAFEGKLSESGFTRSNDEQDLVNNKILQSSNSENPDSDKGRLPKGWKVVELKEVCEIKRGKSKHRPRNEPALYGGKYPFIQTGDIRNSSGKYINEYSQTYSEQGLQQSKLWTKGTLCITIAANIGETAILGFDACFPDSVVGLLCDEKLLLNKYANYFFISFKQKLEELAPATAQKNINVNILERVKIPLASINEQSLIVQAIESRLSVADKMEESITQSLQQAEALRQSILKKAFEGKLINTIN
jgi:type I restriction enzyme S subunit